MRWPFRKSAERTSVAEWLGDPVLFGTALAISAFGLVVLFSTVAGRWPVLLQRQLLWMGAGCGVFLICSQIEYRLWLEAAVPLYGLGVLLLLALSVQGEIRHGASRWLEMGALAFQPSEPMKLVTALVVARMLGRWTALRQGLGWRPIISSALLCGIPSVLILAQPDLGTAMVFALLWFLLIWMAGARPRHLAAIGAAGSLALPIAWHCLKPYQRSRLLVFFNPDLDPLGAGYTVIQSKIAIGSGGLLGQGWRAGTQNQLNFLPERHTDFIFSVVGEEWGLWGAALVLGGFVILLWRVLTVARRQEDPTAVLMLIGILVLVGTHAFVNMGMTMGLLPVVGLPLPFISYGGSAMVTMWAALGIASSIARRR